jgi:NADPH2:quinone reductase
MLKKRGTLCEVGFLGGMEPVENFNPLLDMPSGVNLRFYGTGLVLGNPEFPLSARVFPFEAIQDAHRLMESDQAVGKIVVMV